MDILGKKQQSIELLKNVFSKGISKKNENEEKLPLKLQI